MTDQQQPPSAAWAPPQVCYRHDDRPAGVRCTRCDRPICGECMVPAAVGFQCPECVRLGSKSVRRTSTRYGGRSVGGAPVTISLIAANVAVFLAIIVASPTRLWGQVFIGNAQTAPFDRFALVPPAVVHGQIYRLVSAMFLHYGILHIGSNMLVLYFVGPTVEAALGRWRYVVLYFLAGIGGSILTLAFAGPASQSAGASGAIFGVLGALYVLQRRGGQQTQTILPTIIFNLVITFTIPNISWEGHVGGLITGSLFAVALIATAHQSSGRLQRHLAVTVAAAVLLAASGLIADHHAKAQCFSTTDPDAAFYCVAYQVTRASTDPVIRNDLPGSLVITSVAVKNSTAAVRDSANSARGGHHA